MHFNVGERCIGIESNGGKTDSVYISHAHSDHFVKTSKAIISSEETFKLLQKDELESGELFEGISLHNAGHMLGSTQIRIENGHTTVYTGDFKLRDGFTTKGAEVLECDELIIDSTYGDPAYTFQSKEEIAEEIGEWTQKALKYGKVAFGAYRLGKAQELIAMLNSFDIVPLVDGSIESGCAIYEDCGVRLRRIDFWTEEARERMRDNFVAVLPFHRVKKESSLLRGVWGNTNCALVTGWAKSYRFPVRAFPLSDHAGYDEILEYVERSSAKKVTCKFGEASHLVSELKERGIDATMG